MKQVIKYRTDVAQYSTNTKIMSNCNSITFINVGLSSVLINNISLIVGASLALSGNEYEEDVTEYRIDFGTATNGIIQVIKKINLY